MFFHSKSREISLCYSVEMHCHVLPGIDDGATDASVGASLVERMKQWGITHIIATPHVTLGTFENTPETVASALALLKEELLRRNVEIPVTTSAEYRLDDLFFSQLESGIVRAMPGGNLLVEAPFVQEPLSLDQTLFDLKMKGYKTILAHPERYSYFRHRPERYKSLHMAGTLFQVNLLSLAGYYGKEEKSVAEWFADNGMIDFLGTDMHNLQHADAIEAYLSSSGYRKLLQKLRLKNDNLQG